MTVSDRVRGVILQPRSTFEALVQAPAWTATLLLCTAVSAGAWAGVFATETGRIALVDQWERAAIALGRDVDDTQYADLQRWSLQGPAYAAARALAVGPGLALLAAASLLLAARRFRGATLRQCLAISTHAGVVLAVRDAVAAPVAFFRETTASATAVGVWFSALDEASVAARFVGSLDLFVLWWAALLGIGLATLCGLSARRTAAASLGTFVGLAGTVAIVVGLVGGDG